jgi:uncharacterized protein
VLVAALLLVPALAGAADVVPPPPTRHFDDRAGFVAESAARALDEKLAGFETRTGSQLVVSIFPSLPSPSLEDFTVRTAQAWRVGQHKLDSGLLLFVFVKERKLRLEVGYGLEGKVPDVVAKRVIEDVIAPRFRAGDPAGGLEAGVDALMTVIEGQPTAGPGAATAPATASPERPLGPIEALINALILSRVLGIPLIFPAAFLALALLALPIRLGAIQRRMARGQGFFAAWLAESFRVIAWMAINSGTTYSSRGSSGSSGGFSGGGGRFGGGGASGGW